jgi:hypothetical protein
MTKIKIILEYEDYNEDGALTRKHWRISKEQLTNQVIEAIEKAESMMHTGDSIAITVETNAKKEQQA